MVRLFDRDKIAEIIDTITRNKSRSILTGFGVFWGMFMLLLMLGGGDGIKEKLNKNFEGFATNSGLIYGEATTKPYMGLKKGRYWQLTLRDIDRLNMMVPELEVVTPMLLGGGSPVSHKEMKMDAYVQGVTPEYSMIQEPKLLYGRYINEVDEKQRRRVCVIGEQVYKSLFPHGGDPCGETIIYHGANYQVIGVDVNNANISIGGSSEEMVTIPFSLMRQLEERGDEADILCIRMKDGEKFSAVSDRIREIIYRQHQIHPDDKAALMIFDAEEIFTLVDNIFKGVSLLIWIIGLGTVLAGAIGVSNIMMVTVRERTTEIGIRRAIGATPKMILSQIMSESVMLTAVSGTLGILFSVFVLNMIELSQTHNGILDAHFQISFWTAVMAIVLLSVLGLLAGLMPALRAMGIKPVDAMHDE